MKRLNIGSKQTDYQSLHTNGPKLSHVGGGCLNASCSSNYPIHEKDRFRTLRCPGGEPASRFKQHGTNELLSSVRCSPHHVTGIGSAVGVRRGRRGPTDRRGRR
jgi:hypothetical protein